MKVDLAFWLYFSKFAFSTYGFILFTWWWLQHRGATAVYGYVTLLLFGLSLANAGSAYARWFRLNDPEYYFVITGMWWWSTRLWISLASVVLIVGHMSYRVLWQRHHDE